MRKKAIAFIGYTFLFIMATFIALFYSVAIPVMGLTYHDIYRDFSDYEVSDFSTTKIMLNKDTFALNVYGSSTISFNYKMSSCPSGIVDKDINFSTVLAYQTGVSIFTRSDVLKLPCNTAYTTKEFDTGFYYLTTTQAQGIKDLITGDDSDYMRLVQTYFDNYNMPAYNGITISLQNLEVRNYFYYEFNTVYYFDKIATDLQNFYLVGTNVTILSGGATGGNTNIFLLVAYDSTEYYRIYNTDTSYNVARPRTKYVVDLGEKVTAYGIGAGSYTVAEYNSATYTKQTGVSNTITNQVRYHLINYANNQQTFPGTSMPDLDYQVCDIWDIPCHLGNAITYIALDLPITSDIYGLFSKGFQVVSNGLYAVTGIFGANFNIDGLVSGNFFSITLIISLGVLIVIMMVGGG